MADLALKIKNSDAVTQHFTAAKEGLAKLLRHPAALTIGQVRGVIGAYTAAIEPNFVTWMTVAHKTALSAEAKVLIAQNRDEWIEQDYTKLLREFALYCGVKPTPDDYGRIAVPVVSMWTLFAQKNNVASLAAVAALEDMSPVFMPYLAAVAKMLDCSDFHYTQIHTKVDGNHAQTVMNGLVQEMAYGTDSLTSLIQSVNKVSGFLEIVLTTNPLLPTNPVFDGMSIGCVPAT